MKRPEIVFSTTEHVKQFYGNTNFQRLKAYSAILDGEVIGIAGLRHEKNNLLLFSDMKDSARKYKKDIVRMIRLMDDLIKDIKQPILAIANKNETLSEKILNRLGFKYTGNDFSDGKLFRRT